MVASVEGSGAGLLGVVAGVDSGGSSKHLSEVSEDRCGEGPCANSCRI